LDDNLLDIMIRDMETSPSLYRPTDFWIQGMKEIVEELRQSDLAEFRAMTGTRRFFVPSYAFPGYLDRPDMLAEVIQAAGTVNSRQELAIKGYFSGELQAECDYRVFKATVTDSHPYLDQVSESTVGNPVEQFVFDGRRYSRSMLNYLLGLNFIKQHCDLSDVNTVLEIGGGFGTLGEIFLGDERNHCFYIDVDIPPTGFVASWYLQQVFGADNIGAYDVLRNEKLDITELRQRYRGVVLCPWQLPDLAGKVDLLVNFISFQEMEPEVVQNYLNQVDRLGAKYVLLRNLREGKQKATGDSLGVREPVKGDDYDDFLPNYRLVAANTVPFGYRTVDGFHSELRIYQRKAQ